MCNGEKAKFGGLVDAIWTGKAWILFDQVSAPLASEIVSSLYHLGWGASDIKATYQHQLDMGTKFEILLSDLSELLGSGRPGRDTMRTSMDRIMC